MEYLSQANKNIDFIEPDDKFKFIDDLSFREIINLISLGLSSFHFKSQVPSDINISHNQFLSESQAYINEINDWTKSNLMKLSTEKSKFMNLTDNYKFNTRLSIENNQLEQTKETRLLGVVVNNQLTWHSHTDFIIKRAYKRMTSWANARVKLQGQVHLP